ncbi:hypothetical protein A9Q84_03850 [Halobacteriovorax marinus]|uniref:Outer membrane efflux protein n=1 Tax=Halobacteriovorax marinus TaxID=97084 RepID=A0A1Y5FAC3_9BACT|nr:hypothetical protein A9Q84_03850 [Halobacteriovorax marinus]
MKPIMTLFSLLLLNQMVLAQPTVTLTEELIKEQVETAAPNTLAIEASFLAVDLQRQAFEDGFDLTLNGSSSYTRTSEKSFSTQMPVTSPTKAYKLGVVKPLDSGMSIGVNTFSEQITNSLVKNGTKTGFGIEFSMDLYKNFLGRLTKAQRNLLQGSTKRAGLEKKIQNKAFYQSLRKVYWSLVANSEQRKISESLLNLALRQMKDAKKRYKNKIADIGEVARYESQVADRRAGIISLDYQKELLNQNIKTLLPELSDKNIVLGSYSVENTAKQLFKCTAKIQKFIEPPMHYTYYDEVLSSLQDEYSHQRKITDSYSNVSVEFTSEMQRMGKAPGYSNSWDKFSEEGRNAYSAGVQFVIPLGGSHKKSQKLQQVLEQKRYISQKEEIVGKVNSYHTQVIRNIFLLQKVMAQEKINSSKLEISLKETTKKYNQARLSVRDLIQDQNAYSSSKLLQIQSQLTIITTLLDYFSVYTEIPCEMNN